MNKNSYGYKASFLMLNQGEIYRKDLILYLSYLTGNIIKAGNIVESLEKENILEKREIIKTRVRSDAQSTESVVRLSRHGITTMLDMLDDDYYYQNYKTFQELFNTSNRDTIERQLNEGRAKLMFSACDIPVYPYDKPSLLYLYKTMKIEKAMPDPLYKDSLSKEECRDLLDDGIYYTAKEFRDFLEEIGQTNDVINGSRFSGIYIDSYSCFIVYIPQRRNNRLMLMRDTYESKLSDLAMKTFSSFTYLARELSALEYKRQSENNPDVYIPDNDSRIFNTVNALVISDGDSMVYSMATCNPRGRYKKNNKADTQVSINKIREEGVTDSEGKKKKVKVTSSYLTAKFPLFSRIYVTPFTRVGIDSLSYLLTHTLEEWAMDADNTLSQIEGFVKPKDFIDPVYPYSNGISRVTYMPVFEVKQLCEMSESNYEYTVVSDIDMLDAISHSIRKELTFYDSVSLKKVKQDAVAIYDDHGYIKGEKIIDNYLADNGIKISKKELHQVIEDDFINRYDFYNKVARGEIDFKTYLPLLNQTKVVKKEDRKRAKTSMIGITLTTDAKARIKKAAKYRNMSVSSYIKAIIFDTVNTESALYDEQLSEKRRSTRARLK